MKRNAKWMVYIYNINSRRIEKYNVFDHYRFREDCDKARRKYRADFKEFEKEVRTSLRYYFWSKIEWELNLTGLFSCEKDKEEEKKIDVYDQVELNWEQFINYSWNSYGGDK